MLKEIANKVIKEIGKNYTVKSSTDNQLVNTYLSSYLEMQNFGKRKAKKLKKIVESFSNEKVQVEFNYPDFLMEDDKMIKNKDLVVIGLRQIV